MHARLANNYTHVYIVSDQRDHTSSPSSSCTVASLMIMLRNLRKMGVSSSLWEWTTCVCVCVCVCVECVGCECGEDDLTKFQYNYV